MLASRHGELTVGWPSPQNGHPGIGHPEVVVGILPVTGVFEVQFAGLLYSKTELHPNVRLLQDSVAIARQGRCCVCTWTRPRLLSHISGFQCACTLGTALIWR